MYFYLDSYLIFYLRWAKSVDERPTIFVSALGLEFLQSSEEDAKELASQPDDK